MGKIELEKVLHKELLLVKAKARTKSEIIEEMAKLLYQKGYIQNIASFVSDVYLREEEGETGIGQGVAIPHGKSIAVKETTVSIAILEQEIGWETLDGEGVDVVIMFAVKDTDANTTHIVLLQQIAILLANNHFIKKMKQVSSVDELYQLVLEFK